MPDQNHSLAARAREARTAKQATETRALSAARAELLDLSTSLIRRQLGAEPELIEGTLTETTVDFRVDGLFLRYYAWRKGRSLSLVHPCAQCGQRPGQEVGDFGDLASLANVLDRMEKSKPDPAAICRDCTDADQLDPDADARAVADWAAKELGGAPRA